MDSKRMLLSMVVIVVARLWRRDWRLCLFIDRSIRFHKVNRLPSPGVVHLLDIIPIASAFFGLSIEAQVPRLVPVALSTNASRYRHQSCDFPLV